MARLFPLLLLLHNSSPEVLHDSGSGGKGLATQGYEKLGLYVARLQDSS